MRLTLVVPELIWPEPDDKNALDGLACPALNCLLARGRLQRKAVQSVENTLAEVFGLNPEQPFPFGPLRLAGETVSATAPSPRQGHWLCADPVHLRFHHERVVLADAGAFTISDDEAHALAADLNGEFADLGHFHAATARRWYLRLHAPLSCATQPLSAVAGRRLDGELPEDPQASRLRHWQNEIQMFLHGHPVNAQRSTAGLPAINGLWLWGSGSFPETPNSGLTGVWSEDPLTLGLSRLSGIPTHDLGSLGDVLACQTGHALVVLDQLLGPVLYENSRDWAEAMATLESRWFAPLRQALGKKVSRATLLAPTIYGLLHLELTAADGWKFWRRPQPLAATAQALAA